MFWGEDRLSGSPNVCIQEAFERHTDQRHTRSPSEFIVIKEALGIQRQIRLPPSLPPRHPFVQILHSVDGSCFIHRGGNFSTAQTLK